MAGVTLRTGTTIAARPRWIAPAVDGTGHLYSSGQLRAACGALPVEEKFAYPVRSHCEPCVLSTEPPDVQRQIWGR